MKIAGPYDAARLCYDCGQRPARYIITDVPTRKTVLCGPCLEILIVMTVLLG